MNAPAERHPTRPSRRDAHTSGPPTSRLDDNDSGIDTTVLEQWLPSRLRSSRWLGWRLRALVVLALLGCLALFLPAAFLDKNEKNRP